MSAPLKKISRCGLKFDPEFHTPLEVEFKFIQGGGYIEVKGKKYGEGLFAHYRRAQSLLWPSEDHHTWSDLILKTILDERLTVVQGSRDSSKTRTISKYVLTDYFCFPEITLILMSSTDVRGLELRVWGDLKDLWQQAKDFHKDSIPGYPLDSKHGIFTDTLDPESDDIRDMRKGIICFVTGTMVDTPSGQRPIESLKEGDKVLNAAGIGTVILSGERTAFEVVRVTLSDGRSVDCTPEHPFFTRRGWVKAVDLMKRDMVFSAYEAMSLLQKTTWPRVSEPEVLFSNLPPIPASEDMQALQKRIPSVEEDWERTQRFVLRNGLRVAMGGDDWDGSSSSGQKMPPMPKSDEGGTSKSGILLNCLPGSGIDPTLHALREKVYLSPASINQAEDEILQRILQAELEQFSGGEACPWNNKARENPSEAFYRSEAGLQVLHRKEAKTECATPIHHGLGISGSDAGCGTGRWNPSNPKENDSRQEANKRTEQAWVVSVEVLEQTGNERCSRGGSGYTVHNLHVAGHPSYSVNGILVHNCVPVLDSQGNETKALEKFVGVKQKRRRLVADESQFLPVSYLNILSNLDKGDFKAAFTGNPLGQKALDKVSEPECGWDNHPEPKKTTTWRNKFDGVTINLVGPDSPNFDPNRPKDYTYLVNQDDVDRVRKRYGPDSIEYYSQIMGVRKSGLNPRIVLNSEMCKVNGAYDDCVWGHDEITSVLGIDAGYGGDACETILIKFGNNAQGHPVIKFHEPEVIPINLNDPSTPEDQIANQVRRKCEILKVPYTNVFFEAGMRATLAISLARILGPEVNAVNAGGPATTRPVSEDLFVDDPDRGIGAKRPKRCDEHYSKFITETYFSVRLLVECKQAREIPKSVVKEFSDREWVWARGTRYELETKEDFKLRCHYSPNKADATAIACEGARRLGFQIQRIKTKKELEEGGRDDWLEIEMDKQRQLRKKMELNYQ